MIAKELRKKERKQKKILRERENERTKEWTKKERKQNKNKKRKREERKKTEKRKRYREQISVYLVRHPKAGRNTHLKKQSRTGQDTQHV